MLPCKPMCLMSDYMQAIRDLIQLPLEISWSDKCDTSRFLEANISCGPRGPYLACQLDYIMHTEWFSLPNAAHCSPDTQRREPREEPGNAGRSPCAALAVPVTSSFVPHNLDKCVPAYTHTRTQTFWNICVKQFRSLSTSASSTCAHTDLHSASPVHNHI